MKKIQIFWNVFSAIREKVVNYSRIYTVFFSDFAHNDLEVILQII